MHILIIKDNTQPLPALWQTTLSFLAKTREEIQHIQHPILKSKKHPDMIFIFQEDATLKTTLLIEHLKSSYSTAKLILVSDPQACTSFSLLYQRGISGFIDTNTTETQLICALDLIHSEGVFLPAETVNSIYKRASSIAKEKRLFKVVEALLLGDSDKSIAKKNGCSISTIKKDVSYILKVFNLISRREFGKNNNESYFLNP